jgi:hypothetical protein
VLRLASRFRSRTVFCQTSGLAMSELLPHYPYSRHSLGKLTGQFRADSRLLPGATVISNGQSFIQARTGVRQFQLVAPCAANSPRCSSVNTCAYRLEIHCLPSCVTKQIPESIADIGPDGLPEESRVRGPPSDGGGAFPSKGGRRNEPWGSCGPPTEACWLMLSRSEKNLADPMGHERTGEPHH